MKREIDEPTLQRESRGGNVTTYLNAEMYEAMEAHADKEDTAKSAIMNRAIREYLEREGKR